MIGVEEPSGTAAGSCWRCGCWSRHARIVREIHSDSGAGGIVVQCPEECGEPPAAAERPRTWT